MTLTIKASFKDKVNELYEQYFNLFHSEWGMEGSYEPCVVFGDEEKGAGEYIETITDDQMEFIRQYLGHMMLDGDTSSHLKAIKHFLSMQGAINAPDRMEVRFMLGNPAEVFVYVNDLKEIDLADVYGLTGFQTMFVFNANKQKWTEQAVKLLVKHVKYDLEYDGYEPEIDSRYQGHLLEINCRM